MTSTVELGRRVRVHVPATSANLGPGFDTIGIALSIGDDLVFEAVEGRRVEVVVDGFGAGEVATDERNLVARAFRHVFDDAAIEAPGVRIHASNQVPQSRGMGSSGAAITAGILGAVGMLDGVRSFSEDDLLRLATELEGHPDNVAPCLFGGMTIAWVDAGKPRFKRLNVHRTVSTLVLVPSERGSTHEARALQPEHVSHEDAIFNLSRTALLVAALIQSPELLFEATEDRLHQSYRAAAMPNTIALVDTLRAQGLAAVVSGAGPSVLVLSDDPAERLRAVKVADASSTAKWQPYFVGVDVRGGYIEQLASETPTP